MDFSHLLTPVPSADWLTLFSLTLGILILIGLSEALRHWRGWPVEFTRKFVHILVGVMLIFTPLMIRTSLPLALIAVCFILVNLIVLKKGLLKSFHVGRNSFGTIFYPLSFLILVLFCWPNHAVIIVAAIAPMALGDAAAAIVGESLKSPHEFVLIDDRKSFEGSLTMFAVSATAIFLIIHFYPFGTQNSIASTATALWFSVITALLVSAAEALSSKGSDNLSVPLIAALSLYFLLNHSPDENLRFTLGILLGLLAGAISLYFKFLSPSGAVATFLLAGIIFGFGGWQWTIPILTFFILSSLLSKTGKSVKKRYDLIFEKGSQRDWAQVLANGGVAGILMILYMFFENPLIYWLYLASLASATADSWGTEIGTLFQQTPRLVTTFRKVEPGTSGGISFAGTLGGLLGAFSIALSGWMFYHGKHHEAFFIVLITLSGFLGSIIDSFLGATLQVQYCCPVCQNVTEKKRHCDDAATLHVSGIKWLNNDWVNALSNATAPFFLYFVWLLLSF